MLYMNIQPPVPGVHFHIYSFTIRIKVTPWGVDQVILVCDLVKEISDTIQDITREVWQRYLAILNLSFEPLQIRTVRVQRPEVAL